MKLFEEYLDEGIVKTITPDISRANSLLKEAEQSYSILKQFIEKVGIEDNNANYIVKNTYDIIMELIRARMLRDGYNSSGKGAHEAEVVYLKKIGCDDKDVEFSDQLRYFRNGILYYGKSFDAQYAKKVLAFLQRMYSVLTK